MTITTPINAIRYPSLTDAPNAQTAMGNLATDVDNRVVPRFTSNTTRDAAITSPIDGQIAYRQDAHELDHYHGGLSRWVPAGFVVFGEQIMANSTTSTVTFSSIPQTCRHLQLIIAGHSAAPAFESTFNMTWNGLSAANYNNMRQDINNTPSSTGSFTSGATSAYAGSLPGTSYATGGMGFTYIDFPYYSQANFNKMAHIRSYATDGGASANYHVGACEYGASSTAITSLSFVIGTGFSQNTFFGLYGWG